MRFLVDRRAGATLARWLRGKGHDVAEASERGSDPGDEQLLAQAFAERRVLVTLDKDFGALVFAKGLPHSGVVRLPDVPAAERVRLFERLLATHEKDMANGTVVTVRGDRVRISR